jgi:hypothetical protein
MLGKLCFSEMQLRLQMLLSTLMLLSTGHETAQTNEEYVTLTNCSLVIRNACPWSCVAVSNQVRSFIQQSWSCSASGKLSSMKST